MSKFWQSSVLTRHQQIFLGSLFNPWVFKITCTTEKFHDHHHTEKLFPYISFRFQGLSLLIVYFSRLQLFRWTSLWSWRWRLAIWIFTKGLRFVFLLLCLPSPARNRVSILRVLVSFSPSEYFYSFNSELELQNQFA